MMRTSLSPLTSGAAQGTQAVLAVLAVLAVFANSVTCIQFAIIVISKNFRVKKIKVLL